MADKLDEYKEADEKYTEAALGTLIRECIRKGGTISHVWHDVCLEEDGEIYGDFTIAVVKSR